MSERAIELVKIREMKATISRKIAEGDMSRKEGDRIFKALTVDAPIAATDPSTPDLYEY